MHLDRVRLTLLSAPLTEPVRMSFSQLASRDMVVVELEADGHVGVGESWVNYPAWAAHERMVTLERGIVPLLVGRDVSDPGRLQAELWQQLAGPVRQGGAPGPMWQALSAIDLALWDLLARRAGVSVASLLGGDGARSHVEAYASGIGPSDVETYCRHALERGFTAVKTRVGFDREQDERTLAVTREAVGDDVKVYADANQAWDVAEAADFCTWAAPYRIGWLEEPVAGNRIEDLVALASRVEMPLACGENLYGADEFDRYLDAGVIDLIQPDLTKSGGFSLVDRVGRRLPSGVGLVPHCYGGALVTAASVQIAAASPRVPYIELDTRPNPLRDEILRTPLEVADGRVTVPDGPGLGVELDQDALEKYVVDRKDCDLHAVV